MKAPETSVAITAAAAAIQAALDEVWFSLELGGKLGVATLAGNGALGTSKRPASLGAKTGGNASDDGGAWAMSFFRSMRPESSKDDDRVGDDFVSAFATSALRDTTELSSFCRDKLPVDVEAPPT